MILVVDDDTLVLENTAAMLEDLSHRVIEARSCQEALDLLGHSNSVDLVLTDQAMPGMTGAQLAGAVKARWAGMPIILATGYAGLPADPSGQAQQAVRAGPACTDHFGPGKADRPRSSFIEEPVRGRGNRRG